jgi:hypothetical protein
MTGRPLDVVTTPLTTLFTVVAAEVERPISDFDSTVRRGPLGVMTGNETDNTKKYSFYFYFLLLHILFSSFL